MRVKVRASWIQVRSSSSSASGSTGKAAVVPGRYFRWAVSYRSLVNDLRGCVKAGEMAGPVYDLGESSKPHHTTSANLLFAPTSHPARKPSAPRVQLRNPVGAGLLLRSGGERRYASVRATVPVSSQPGCLPSALSPRSISSPWTRRNRSVPVKPTTTAELQRLQAIKLSRSGRSEGARQSAPRSDQPLRGSRPPRPPGDRAAQGAGAALPRARSHRGHEAARRSSSVIRTTTSLAISMPGNCARP